MGRWSQYELQRVKSNQQDIGDHQMNMHQVNTQYKQECRGDELLQNISGRINAWWQLCRQEDDLNMLNWHRGQTEDILSTTIQYLAELLEDTQLCVLCRGRLQGNSILEHGQISIGSLIAKLKEQKVTSKGDAVLIWQNLTDTMRPVMRQHYCSRFVHQVI